MTLAILPKSAPKAANLPMLSKSVEEFPHSCSNKTTPKKAPAQTPNNVPSTGIGNKNVKKRPPRKAPRKAPQPPALLAPACFANLLPSNVSKTSAAIAKANKTAKDKYSPKKTSQMEGKAINQLPGSPKMIIKKQLHTQSMLRIKKINCSTILMYLHSTI